MPVRRQPSWRTQAGTGTDQWRPLEGGPLAEGCKIDPLEDVLGRRSPRVRGRRPPRDRSSTEDAVLADGEERSAAAGVDQEALVEVERLALADTARPRQCRREAERPPPREPAARPDSLQNPGQVSSADGP